MIETILFINISDEERAMQIVNSSRIYKIVYAQKILKVNLHKF